jgi:hypothetical protein
MGITKYNLAKEKQPGLDEYSGGHFRHDGSDSEIVGAMIKSDRVFQIAGGNRASSYRGCPAIVLL